MSIAFFGIGSYLMVQIGYRTSVCPLSSGWLCGIPTLCVAAFNVFACVVRMYRHRHGALLHRVSLNVAYAYAIFLCFGPRRPVLEGEWLAVYVFLFHVLFAKDGFWLCTMGTSLTSLIGYFVMIFRMDEDKMVNTKAVYAVAGVTYWYIMNLALYAFERESRNLFVCNVARQQERKRHKKAMQKQIDLGCNQQHAFNQFHESFVDSLGRVQSSLECDMVFSSLSVLIPDKSVFTARDSRLSRC